MGLDTLFAPIMLRDTQHRKDLCTDRRFLFFLARIMFNLRLEIADLMVP